MIKTIGFYLTLILIFCAVYIFLFFPNEYFYIEHWTRDYFAPAVVKIIQTEIETTSDTKKTYRAMLVWDGRLFSVHTQALKSYGNPKAIVVIWNRKLEFLNLPEIKVAFSNLSYDQKFGSFKAVEMKWMNLKTLWFSVIVGKKVFSCEVEDITNEQSPLKCTAQ